MMFQNMTGRICSFSRVRSFEKKRSFALAGREYARSACGLLKSSRKRVKTVNTAHSAIAAIHTYAMT